MLYVCKTCGAVVDESIVILGTESVASTHARQCTPNPDRVLVDLVLPTGWRVTKAWTPRGIFSATGIGVFLGLIAALFLLQPSRLEDDWNGLGFAPTQDGSCTVIWNTTPMHFVKGNINSSGERIYHVEGGQAYERTRAERCFTSEYAAEEAGFRPSRR